MERIVRRATGLAAMAVAAAFAAGELPAQTGIDDARLERARADGEWLTHGGDYAETRYSSLDQITRDNVDELGLAWSVEVGSEDGRQETTPLVADGVLYATTTWNVLFAIDLRTQQLKWKWDPGAPRGRELGGPRYCCGPVNRGPALWGDLVFMGIIDGRLAALDRETGEVEWVVKTTPYDEVYSITGAPRVVDGKVVIGNGGGDFGARGYVTAYDAATGQQVWRTYVVPGDPALGFESEAMAAAAETWTGEWWEYGGGGTAWDAFAYDPENDLLYVGTGNGGPWNRDLRSPGGGDNLYLTSILALRPDTGEQVWHYQTVPGESWDYTAVQHMILADLMIDGEVREVLMQAPKNGFFYVLDRVTGEFISAAPISRLNWASGIDEHGRPIVRPEARYGTAPVILHPGPRGAHNWHPMSYNPGTGLVYIPGQDNNFTYRADLDQYLGIVFGGNSRPPIEDPITPPFIGAEPPPGRPGFLLAWDPVEQKEAWRVTYPTRENSGTLTTAGDLVFHGTRDGVFQALDAATGEILWEMPLLGTMGSPVTYTIDGRQYVSIMSGTPNNDPPGRLFTFALGAEGSVSGN